MDLGINGRKAIVCAASKGLGRACALSLAREGVDLVITARTEDALEADGGGDPQGDRRAASPRSPGDIIDRGGPRAALAACPERRTSWSTTPAGRRPAISASGTATPGSARSTPTCWRRSS